MHVNFWVFASLTKSNRLQVLDAYGFINWSFHQAIRLLDLFNLSNSFLKRVSANFKLSLLLGLILSFLHNFIKIYDLQNSSRTSFYKRILFPKADKNIWSSSETTIPIGGTKADFDKYSVLQRFEHQLKVSGLKTEFTIKPDFSWL